jgi:hypothetical protein
VTDSESPVSGDERASALHAALAVEDLVAANNESNKTMLSLVHRVREETAARDRKVDALEKAHRQMRWVIMLSVVLIVFLLTLGVINAFNLNSTRKSQRQVQAIAASTDQTNRTLLDCVNSTGVCGQVNAANQAKILDTVKLYELTVLYCARTNPQPVDPSGDKFIACVAKLYPGGPTLNRRGE